MKKTVYVCLGALVSSAVLIAGCFSEGGARDGEDAIDSEGPIGSDSAAITVDLKDYDDLNPSIKKALQGIGATQDSSAAFLSAVKANDSGNVVATFVKYGVSADYMNSLAIDFPEPEADPGPGADGKLSLYVEAAKPEWPQPTMVWLRTDKSWINIGMQDDHGVIVLVPAVKPGKRGLTWRKVSHDSTRGQDTVSCNMTCDPYIGDTLCTSVRPILCIRQDGSGSNGFVSSFYNGWAKGNIGLTPPVPGTALTSLAAANNLCVATFGAGWRMGEHHDGGGGWQWTAYGNLNDLYNVSVLPYDATKRFWVHINDQPGNCWN